jgi:long-subunit acyl-CoA synthetase (AMP-forming)
MEKPFSIEEKELTTSLKLRRRFIEEKYQEQIEQMYSVIAVAS